MSDGIIQHLQDHRESILQLAETYGVTHVRVFGSVVRGEDTPTSDIDFLVHFDTRRNPSDFYQFKRKLRRILRRKVDVIRDSSLQWFMKPLIEREALPL